MPPNSSNRFSRQKRKQKGLLSLIFQIINKSQADTQSFYQKGRFLVLQTQRPLDGPSIIIIYPKIISDTKILQFCEKKEIQQKENPAKRASPEVSILQLLSTAGTDKHAGLTVG